MSFIARPITRRGAIGLLCGGAASVAGGRPGGARDATIPEVQSLGAIAEKRGLLFGAAIAAHELEKGYGGNYARMYARDARIVTTDLELKLAMLRDKPGPLDFTQADALFAFAAAHNMKVRGHTLIWNDWVPAWIKSLSKMEVARLLSEHIESVVSRYEGRVHSWDVVNEPISPWENNPGRLRGGVFYEALGKNYIARSFRLARSFDPKARLILNETGTEDNSAHGVIWRENFSNLVDELLHDGVPLDGVGFECHLEASKPPKYDQYAEYVQSFAARGLDIHITELDVDDKGLPDAVAERDQLVAKVYYDFLKAVLPIKSLKAVVTWQLGDGHSWYHYEAIEKHTRLPRPLLYDAAYHRKPAWYAVARAFSEMPAR